MYSSENLKFGSTLNERISFILDVQRTDHNLQFIKDSLQIAVEVELFTLPIYLFAFWSIKNEADYSARSVQTVMLEEMTHLGLVCNLLTAVGGVPVLSNAPQYPNELPGHIQPGLRIGLEPFSAATLDKFMAIEYPENGPVVVSGQNLPSENLPNTSTIGAFYDVLLHAFHDVNPPITLNNQIEDTNIDVLFIHDMARVDAAIGTIKKQGEGTSGSPVDTNPADLAHYYRFAECRVGRQLHFDEPAQTWMYNGDSIPMPQVWPVAPVPNGGYLESDVDPTVWALIAKFDQNYSSMLRQLEAAWQGGTLNAAVHTMFTLSQPAKALMEINIPSTPYNYGPCFRFV